MGMHHARFVCCLRQKKVLATSRGKIIEEVVTWLRYLKL